MKPLAYLIVDTFEGRVRPHTRPYRTAALAESCGAAHGVGCGLSQIVPVGPIKSEGTPKTIVDLYEEAQVNSDMGNGTYVGGTDHYGIGRILESISEDAGWTLPPRMNLKARKEWLKGQGREDEIEYLGVNDE